MSKMKFLIRVLFFIFFLSLLSGCKSTITYKSLDDAISKSIPYQVSSILHIENIQDGVIVFYLSPRDDYHLIAVAFYKGDDERGWVKEGPMDLVDYYSEQMSFNVETAAFYPQNLSNSYERLQVIFGQINDINIRDVKVGGANIEFVNANILETPEGRFYFKVGNYNIVQGLNVDGEIVLRIGQ